MKRYTGIYEQIYDFANLERAYKKARRASVIVTKFCGIREILKKTLSICKIT